MARDLYFTANLCTLLDLYKGTKFTVIADLAAIQVDEGINLDILAQFHVGCDAHKIPCCHLSPPLSHHLLMNIELILRHGPSGNHHSHCCVVLYLH